MNPIIYAINIGTMATWLSLSGASTVAGFWDPGAVLAVIAQPEPESMTDGPVFDMDTFSAGSSSAAEVDAEDNQETLQAPEAATEEPVEELPEVPELPEVAAVEPLPEVPDLPEPEPEKPSPTADLMHRPVTKPPAAKTATRSSPQAKRGSDGPVAKRTTTGSGVGNGSGSSQGAGSGDVGAARFAGGRKPKPPYPPEARKQNLEGSVLVFITVDETGNVVDVKIRNSSHACFNDPSVTNTIRRWKFRPGPRGSITQTIRFTLN